ncbi:MAG: hypothetical protein OEV78_07555 [Spirochaetia bacterium]|nr:hypothetical protein [Spirochaetia bacterium]
MFSNIFKKIEARAVLANIFLALVVQTLVQVILIWIISPKLQEYSQGKMLDLRFLYTEHDMIQYFTELGTSGRNLYFFAELIDLIYPLAYTATFILLLVFLGKYAFPSTQVTKVAIIAPLLLLFSDYMENIIVIILLLIFPDENYLYKIAGFVTLGKFLLLFLNFIIVSVFGLMALKKEML